MEGEAGGFMDERKRERESGKKYKRVISNILVLQILAVVHRPVPIFGTNVLVYLNTINYQIHKLIGFQVFEWLSFGLICVFDS